MSEKVLVSVICTVYNHEPYLRECLQSLVNQQTSFPYQIIVHDDASTDNSPSIIKEYASKYSDKIIPIFETQNQYSRGVRIAKLFVPYIKGVYVASCEGDDYWTNPNKLQIQVDFLESHKDYIACAHNTIRLDCRSGKKTAMYSSKSDKDILLDDVVFGGGTAYHTSSIVRKADFFLPPDELSAKSFGDYPNSIYLTLNGKVRYLKDIMSVYRFFSNGSFTSRNSKKSKEVRAEVAEEACQMLERFDNYTKGKYHALFKEAIDYNKMRALYILGNYKGIVFDNSLRNVYFKHNSMIRIVYLLFKSVIQ